MFSKTKTNRKLGVQVHEHLKELGIETPMTENVLAISDEETRTEIEKHLKSIMELQGLDLSDDSLIETPKRWSVVLTKEKFYGLDYENFPKCTTVENKAKDSDPVILRKIEVKSLCEHHYEPIIGHCYIAYIPGKNIMGLSKFNRIVDFFSRRPQIQERLTKQIFHALKFILDTDDIGIVIDAEHMCVKMRGVEDPCSDTTTLKLGGVFSEETTEQRAFFSAIDTARVS